MLDKDQDNDNPVSFFKVLKKFGSSVYFLRIIPGDGYQDAVI